MATKILSFGLNFNGQLGYEGYDNKNPRGVNVPSDLVALQAGWNCSVALNAEGVPYFWGTMPVKYEGKAKFQEPLPLPSISAGFQLPRRVLQIAAGRAHIMLLTDDGVAHSFGQGEWGKLGHGGTANELYPRALEIQGQVTQIGVGDQHSAALTNGGQVYTWGQGIYGQLGHGTRKDLNHPRRVEGLVRAQQTVVSLAVGYDQTFAINADGVVYSWGAKGAWLGHPNLTDHLPQPQEVALLKNKAKITQVGVGKQHTLLLTVDGKVYSMGKNKDGCLGQGKAVKKETPNPLIISTLNNSKIIQVAAGEKHSIVLADDGTVYAFGSGSNGRLGLGDSKSQEVPRAVQGIFDKACAVAAGFEHTLVMTGTLPSSSQSDDAGEKKSSRKASKSSKGSKSSSSGKSSSRKVSSPKGKGKGNYTGFNSDSSNESEDEEEEEEEELSSKKSSKKKSSKKKTIRGKLDEDVEVMLKDLGLLDVAPIFIKAGITWPVLLQFKKVDLDELGLDVGPRVAIANYLQAAKNKFKVGEAGSIKATIESHDLVFHKKLGEGNFGDVWMGKLRGTTTVAIKTIRSEDKTAFLLEAHIMAQLPAHPNVVTFFGLSSDDTKNELFLVTEFVADGSLDRYLTENIGKIGTETLIQMTRDMAAGCDHLSAHGIVHRDLAARNLLLEIKRSGEHHVKVCDFGLSRGLIENEYNSQMKNVPVRWTAPEAFKFRKYTSKSDVWSFAVTLWEIFSFGQTPYTGMTPLQVVKALDSGYRLSRPEFCPKRLYDEIICKCLNMDAEQRPTFNEIFRKLEELYPNGKISDDELAELRSSRQQQQPAGSSPDSRDMFIVEGAGEDEDDETQTGEYSHSDYGLMSKREQRQAADGGKKKKKKKTKKSTDDADGKEKNDQTDLKKTKKKKKKSSADGEKKKKEKKPSSSSSSSASTMRTGEYAVNLDLQRQAEDSGIYLVDPPSSPTSSSSSSVRSSQPSSAAPAPTTSSSVVMSLAEMTEMKEYA